MPGVAGVVGLSGPVWFGLTPPLLLPVGLPVAAGSVPVDSARALNTSVSAAGVTMTVTDWSGLVVTAVTLSSSPCGASTAGAATSTFPAASACTWPGAGAGQVRVAPVLPASAPVVASVSTTVCVVTAVTGATGALVAPAVPVPAEELAVMLTE